MTPFEAERDCLGRKVREVSARDSRWGLPTAVNVYLNTAGTAHRTERAAQTPRGREAFRSPGTGHWETVARSRKRHAQCPAGTAVSEVRKAAGGSESVACLVLKTAGSDAFTYDADGSMLTGAGRTMA
ncbi:MAG: hypothetical protein OXP11_12945, partial [Gammaproteobacteria bacterium]|nr:hypothetical protein [Gammaproteobacteria bacterium]